MISYLVIFFLRTTSFRTRVVVQCPIADDILIPANSDVVIVVPSTTPNFVERENGKIDYASIKGHLRLADVKTDNIIVSGDVREMAEFNEIRKMIIETIKDGGGEDVLTRWVYSVCV